MDLANNSYEDLFVVMFGGLHIEMGMWMMLGQYLASSGWTNTLTDAGIAMAGTSDNILKTSHPTRTPRAHQLTCASFSKKSTNLLYIDDNNRSSFEAWRENDQE